MGLKGLVAKTVKVNGKQMAWMTREEDKVVHIWPDVAIQPIITDLLAQTNVTIELWRNRRHPVYFKEVFTNFGKVTGFTPEGLVIIKELAKPLDLMAMRISEIYFTFPIADKAKVAAVIAKYS